MAAERRTPFGSTLHYYPSSSRGDKDYLHHRTIISLRGGSPIGEKGAKDLNYSCFGIFKGHGGVAAAEYAMLNLEDRFVTKPDFLSDDDSRIRKSLKDAFISIQNEIFVVREIWKKSESGDPIRAGTTAVMVIIKNGKVYIAHLGDSAVVLGFKETPSSILWTAKKLTLDHKPDNAPELQRILEAGGKVIPTNDGTTATVVLDFDRVKQVDSEGNRNSSPGIPNVDVSRSLGEFWSYNPEKQEYLVSPIPEVHVVKLDASIHRCLIIGTSAVWKAFAPHKAVNLVYSCESNNTRRRNARTRGSSIQFRDLDPAKRLVKRTCDYRGVKNMPTDNISVVVVVFD